MNIAPFSDLHVEASGVALEPNNAAVVVLAGDIFAAGQATKASYNTTIDWIARAVEDRVVVFVPGNHDFEEACVHRQMDAWKNISQTQYDGRIHVLWDEAVDIDGVRFLGTPLFTNFAATSATEEVKEYAQNNIIDFRSIRVNNRWVTPDDYIEWHNKSRAFLHQEIKKDVDVPKVVVTHFAPSAHMNSKRYNHQQAAYWYSDCEDLVALANVWVSGHTHHSCADHIGEVPHLGHLVSNARGHNKWYNLSGDPNFSRSKVIPVPKLPSLNPVKASLFNGI